MIEQALIRSHCSTRQRLTVKALLSCGIVALAVILPQIAHLVAGPRAGLTLLPMYLPVLLGGCLLGPRFGLAVGLLSPAVSCLLTSWAGSPMPAPARLPFMMAELALFAGISGLFAARMERHPLLAFPTVLAAAVGGRASFLLLAFLFEAVAPFTAATVWSQIVQGLPGLCLQLVLVPLMVIGIHALLHRERRS